MDYIKRIKEVKNAQKMTNDELAARTGIPGGTLSKILAGISESPKLCNIVAICEALNCSLDYIMYGLEENKNNYTLDEEEIDLIERYRALDSRGKETVSALIDAQESYLPRTERATPARARILQSKSLSERLAAAYAEKLCPCRHHFCQGAPVAPDGSAMVWTRGRYPSFVRPCDRGRAVPADSCYAGQKGS